MTVVTPTISLTLYDSSGDQAATFATFRAVQSGTASTSNMYRIDTAVAADRARLTALEATRGAILVPALYVSANYYEASGITEITSLTTNMTIILTVDTESAGTVTMNINSLGTKTVSKINGAGAVINLSGTDLKVGRNYLFRYDGTQWIWVSATDPMFIEETIHASTAKSPPVDADEFGLIDSAASWILKKVTLAVLKLAIYVGIKPANGVMWNGKITPSVATNDLTLALKTFAGTDPSATDPVYITIGGTVRTITSALSVTKLDGTNWCNSGSPELGTKEIDYFVYLGYNATDGVVIGFSRIPYGKIYSDFSATTTNEKYCAISTITNAAAGDNYVNIGRFAATLSLTGTGFLWTVPTFTTINLIQSPILETRWISFTLVGTNLTVGNGTTNIAVYKIFSDRLYVNLKFTLGSSSSVGTNPCFALPFSVSTNNQLAAAPFGVARFSGGGTSYLGAMDLDGTNYNLIRFICYGVGATYATLDSITATVPHTWTTAYYFTGNASAQI